MAFLKAFSVFLGTVIGVGIFSLPFVAFKAGFLVVIGYFLFMVVVVISIHFLYGEIVLGTEKIHRLPGYVGEYLGQNWEKLAFLVITVGLTGTLLVYLIVGGQFLNFLFSPLFGGNPTIYTLLFFITGAYLVFRGIKSISGVELSLLIVFLVILAVFFAKSFSSININYLSTLNLKFLIFPYGIILFSLWGSDMVPEIKEMLAKSRTKNLKEIRTDLRKVLFWGIIFAAVIYLFFIFIVLGVSGSQTSKEAISGLAEVLGDNVIKLGFIFGIITCFTSFLTLALTLKKVFWYDLGLSKNFSWFLTCFLPLFLFFAGLREFIGIISFTGAITLGIGGMLIIFSYRSFLKKKFSRKMNPTLYLLVGVFILGIIFEIIYFLSR